MPKSNTGAFSGSADSFYDPEFTVQISSKMQVPDKISVIEGSVKENSKVQDSKVYMHVPERIMVAGGNEHIAARDPLPELRMEQNLQTEAKPEIQTPPRVLTLNEYEYPSIDVDHMANKKKDCVNNCVSGMNESPLGLNHAPEGELKLISTEMKLMRKRINQLELENQARNNREIILYSFGLVYFVLKGIMWLNRHI